MEEDVGLERPLPQLSENSISAPSLCSLCPIDPPPVTRFLTRGRTHTHTHRVSEGLRELKTYLTEEYANALSAVDRA